jgi:short-subunit dehydrogenase
VRSFQDKVAVVTGAASGIGRALAQELARRGAELALVDVSEAALAETAASIAATGRRVTTHVVDVADAARMEALAEAVVAAHGRVELLVNNAGVSVTGTFEEQSLDDWRWIVGVNFWGVVHGCKFFLPHLRKNAEGHIVNLSSTFGIVGMPTQSSYSATKFAVRGLSEALWAELRGSGIGVTSVHPGAVKTNIVRASRSADPSAKQQMALRFDRMAMAPEKVARKILRAVERDKLRVVISPAAHAADWAKRLFPADVHRILAYGYRRVAASGARSEP